MSESPEPAANPSLVKRIWGLAREAVRRYFAAGLLAFAPIAITTWAIAWIVQHLDNLLLPKVLGWLFPDVDPAPDVPPLVGAIFTFLVILLAGVVVRHLFGHELVRWSEKLVARVPIAGSIYAGVKQLFEAIINTSSARRGYSRVVLIEYPRRGLYGLAFVTGELRGPVANAFDGRSFLNVFVPTTPNPTSGFYLVVPEEDVIDVAITVEDAFKIIMSAGIVSPQPQLAPRPPQVDPLPPPHL